MTRPSIHARRFRAVSIAIGLICMLSPDQPSWRVTGVAMAQVDDQETLESEKAYWQERYRRLRNEAARLRREIEEARAGYAAANRRNYRRGPVRHEYRAKMQEAEKELARVEEELSTLADDARRAGALPGWLYEVEMEPVAPAAREGAAADRGPAPDDEEDGDDWSDRDQEEEEEERW